MRFSMVTFNCVLISSLSSGPRESKFGAFVKSGIQILLSSGRPLARFAKYESGIPYTFFANIFTMAGSGFDPGRRDRDAQWFCRRKCLNPQKFISLMKLSRKLYGVITTILSPRVPNRASAAAIAEHVFPLPSPWYTSRPRYGVSKRRYSRMNS